MAMRSMIFKAAFRNFLLFGEAQSLSRYSRVNHPIQIASTTVKCLLSVTLLNSSRSWMLGSVLRVNAVVDRMMNSTDITAKTWNMRYNEFCVEPVLPNKIY